MSRHICWMSVMILLMSCVSRLCLAEDALSLRLVPFPKEISLTSDTFPVDQALVLQASPDSAESVLRLIQAELSRAGKHAPIEVRPLAGAAHVMRLAARPAAEVAAVSFRDGATAEDYVLEITPDAITARGFGAAGLLHGTQTLCQLIRANLRPTGLPCLRIRDWPSLRWRCFQDDLTRGPSSRLDTLKHEVALGAYLRMNLFTYYMEYQFAFKKHPLIGPKDGSLESQELRALVDYARSIGVDILGNQQSFGHFGRILQNDQYAALRETPDVLTPVKEQTYQLLDDLYSEVCPILPFEMFNVCCDETWGLGTGPSKELAATIGVGGVYVRHIRRVHDLLKERHGKRMMMWGDIILEHPDRLNKIPKDTVMLTWGYDPRPSFEHQIEPFARSGYAFFVCPGVSNWSRILPDFAVATTNIRNFVRDGVKHGAMGMLNTSWEDDGEALKGIIWHGHAWAAECAWNASATEPAAFSRRIGAVLFGEKGDHFGQAIDLIAQTHLLPGMKGMNNSRFWDNDFAPQRNPEAIEASANKLLTLVRPAIKHLEACRREATVNQELLDACLFGAKRMELIGQRMLDGLQAARAYAEARKSDAQRATALLGEAQSLVRRNKAAHDRLRTEFAALWLSESKPYALDWTMRRYESLLRWYDDLDARLTKAREQLAVGRPPPEPGEVGLALPEQSYRQTEPSRLAATPLGADMPWADPAATHRLGVLVRAGSADRHDLPIEVNVNVPQAMQGKGVAAYCTIAGAAPRRIPAQFNSSEAAGKARLVFLLPGPLPKDTDAQVHVYLGITPDQSRAASAWTTDAPNGMKWLENDRVRLLLGPEGAHIYRWEIKALANRDLTMPGESAWAGFSDLGGGDRHTTYTLTCTANGPAMVRYQCTSPDGIVKTITLFAGTSWVEVALSEPTSYYWDFDAPSNFAAESSTPGRYLFSNHATGPVGREADGVPAQVKAAGTFWAIKWNTQRLALGMSTPEAPVHFHIAPGAGAGGVGIESSPPASHFITYAGLLDSEPKAQMEQLRQTLNLKNQPEVIVHPIQERR